MIQKNVRRKPRLMANLQFCLSALLLGWALTGMAQSQSDLLIIIDEDGLGYVAQHTLFATDELIVSRLPPERDTLSTVFSGSVRDVYRTAYENDPDKILLSNGSVFTRYRHRFNQAESLTEQEEQNVEVPVLSATIDDIHLIMADMRSHMMRISWHLPPNLELLSYKASNPAENDNPGTWKQHDNVITFEQTGEQPMQITVEYRVHRNSERRDNACVASVGPSEWCSPDVDLDGVPDYRDICLPPIIEQRAADTDQSVVLSDKQDGLSRPGTAPVSASSTSLGCGDEELIVLTDIQFESGQTYLNAQARRTLDKVAVALQRQPERLFRVATHTDNAGYIRNNQALSENRADAIRHYLMLRGLGPNQVQARGYGETSPAHDNRTAAGRRANRRVELQRLN